MCSRRCPDRSSIAEAPLRVVCTGAKHGEQPGRPRPRTPPPPAALKALENSHRWASAMQDRTRMP
eukprot:360255-Chlamydomonas_euryale.AAC.11